MVRGYLILRSGYLPRAWRDLDLWRCQLHRQELSSCRRAAVRPAVCDFPHVPGDGLPDALAANQGHRSRTVGCDADGAGNCWKDDPTYVSCHHPAPAGRARDREIDHIWRLFLLPYISGNDRCLRFGLRALSQDHGVSLKVGPKAPLARSWPKRSWRHPGWRFVAILKPAA